MYEWNELPKDENDFNKGLFEPYDGQYHTRQFDLKYDKIKKEVSINLGSPETEVMESKQNISPFRDDTKWSSDSGIHAYLFMFGNENGWRQIRLVVYKD